MLSCLSLSFSLSQVPIVALPQQPHDDTLPSSTSPSYELDEFFFFAPTLSHPDPHLRASEYIRKYMMKSTSTVEVSDQAWSACTAKGMGARLVRKAQRALMAERFREMRAERAARMLPLLALLGLILRKRARAIAVWSTTRAVWAAKSTPHVAERAHRCRRGARRR